MCPACIQVVAITANEGRGHRCTNCDAELRLCENYLDHSACNRGVEAESEHDRCRYCGLNRTIPDLSIVGNLDKWQRLEFAKHRVLFDVERIGFPILNMAKPHLRFDFKSSADKPVSTGHAKGLITVDIAEADSVFRERARVEFGEPQRTLVGHFRHELGHFYWELLVQPQRIDACRTWLVDKRSPSYGDGQKRYYDQGPPADWQSKFVSEYATMHSWEDFAETFGAYLDMVAVVETGQYSEFVNLQADQADFAAMFAAYCKIGIMANELNRDMGLLDLVPEIFTPQVIEKLRFVHSLGGSPTAA